MEKTVRLLILVLFIYFSYSIKIKAEEFTRDQSLDLLNENADLIGNVGSTLTNISEIQMNLQENGKSTGDRKLFLKQREKMDEEIDLYLNQLQKMIVLSESSDLFNVSEDCNSKQVDQSKELLKNLNNEFDSLQNTSEGKLDNEAINLVLIEYSFFVFMLGEAQPIRDLILACSKL